MSKLGTSWVPQPHRDITLARLDTFSNSERWQSDVNIQQALWRHRQPVSLSVWDAPGLTRPKFEEAVKQQFRPCKVGESFGPSWSTHWFKVEVQVPSHWTDAPEGTPLVFVWDSGSEAMVWTEEGSPQQGLTDSRNEYILSESVAPGASFTLYVEMASNGVGGCSDTLLPPPTDRYYTLQVADVAVPCVPAQQLLADFKVVADMAKSLPADSAAGARALHIANKIINTFRLDDPSTWQAARDLAAQVLELRGASTLHKVTAVGHCHIDTAWLWPFEETHRKVARSWVSQLKLMEQYPDHVFAASSAQQYAWLKDDYPDIWSRVTDAVISGRFVPVGGAWVECDTNLPGGESLVRQMLFGQRFFESAFGNRCDVFWLPDTFGYAAQLPQLIQGAGMSYMLTQKLSWNSINPFPHSTFLWEALDGSSVITHFPPSNTYGSQATVSDLLTSVTNHHDKDRSPCSLLLFGNGDGGGGPTAAMCEAMSRLADPQALGIDGVVRCVQGSPSQFFRDLQDQAEDLLTWKGELYFELHRGTYTSHGANKVANRRCEGLLREVEMLGALAGLVHAGQFSYPHQQLDRLWKEVLLFQFHDVLPGSSIELVYRHTADRYPHMQDELVQLRSAALVALVKGVAPSHHHHQPHHHHQHASCCPGDDVSRDVSRADAHGPDSTCQQAQAAQHAPASAADSSWVLLKSSDVHGAHSDVQVAADAQVDAYLAQLNLSQPDSTPAGSLSSAAPAPAPGPDELASAAAGPWLFNSLSFERREVVEVPAALVPRDASVQWSQAGRSPGSGLVLVTLPGLSFTPAFSHASRTASHALMSGVEEGATACQLQAANGDMVYQLMNRFVRATFSSAGRLVSLYDRVWQRELVPQQLADDGKGPALGNRLRLYEDIPKFWDAWDVEVYHLEKGWDAGVPSRLEIIESGPLRSCLRYTCALSGGSKLEQDILLTAASPCIEFSTAVDWQENRKLLKVEFPWSLTADTATYEVQFGAMSRPTHQNTSWDWARFEVVAHRWADLSEPDYGVALLNDCKYGHATHGSTQRLTLLKAPKAPDGSADMGRHNIRYGILPHAHGWQAGGVVTAGLAFNTPPLLVGAASLGSGPCDWVRSRAATPLIQVLPAVPPPVPTPGGPLIIDTIKAAELPVHMDAGSSTGGPAAALPQLVLRLYEPHGSRGRAVVSLGPGMSLVRAALGNLLEDVTQELQVAAGDASKVELPYTPFQVLTLMLWIK